MNGIWVLKNPIQEYAWGSKVAIPELLGTAASSRPQAELWMGAHPKAPSLVKYAGTWTSLPELIEENPEGILGEEVAARFGGRLPYLFKVLAAAEPLSLQAHPSKIQAEEGFERENGDCIPMGAANRTYRDDNHKPECVCALTPFWALNGFREARGALAYLEELLPGEAVPELRDLPLQEGALGPEGLFRALLGIERERRKGVLEQAASHAGKRRAGDPVFQWVAALHDFYPTDVGILAPALMNLVRLEPGQAMFLPAGELHAYLDGVGIELMANSDNVLRGGLTGKHIDVPELMKVLTFKERKVEILSPSETRDHEYAYDTPAEEFALSVICLDKENTYRSDAERSVEILLCTDGKGVVNESDSVNGLTVSKGVSVLIPASLGQYAISGGAQEGTVLYKASVPL